MKDLRRICILCFEDPRSIGGGVQRRIGEEIRFYSGQGVDVTVVMEGRNPIFFSNGIRYISFSTPKVIFPLRYGIFILRAGAFLRKHQDFDVVEAHHVAGAAVSWAFPFRRRPPFLFSEMIHGIVLDEWKVYLRHHGWISKNIILALGLLALSPLEWISARKANIVLTLSRYTSSQVEKQYRVPSSKIHCFPNGIDPTRFYADNREEQGTKASQICRVLFVGRWEPRKGILQLLKAFALARKRIPVLRLQLAGGGILEGDIQRLCGRLGITDGVEFLGWLKGDQLVEAYRATDIVVIPSFQEGQGIVALEAQACGKPVIATRAGGLVETLKEGETGLLVPIGDVPALAIAIQELAERPALRRLMGSNAAVWAGNFTWKTMLSPQLDFYLEQLQKNREENGKTKE